MPDTSHSYKITFIGAGRMASAMIRSLLRSKQFSAGELACCSAKDGTAEALVAETGIALIDLATLPSFQTDTLVLACKPQQLKTVSDTVIRSAKGALLVSILAGTTLKTLNARFSAVRNAVRVMPNTPGSVGAGMSAYAANSVLSNADRDRVTVLLGSMGAYIEVREQELDAITAVSGSGPAYLFLFVEAMAEAAIEQGFAPDIAMLLAKQTVIGSAKLLEQSEFLPAELRRQVTSPGGTTQAAIESFQANHFNAIVAKAVQAAHDRSVELGKLD